MFDRLEVKVRSQPDGNHPGRIDLIGWIAEGILGASIRRQSYLIKPPKFETCVCRRESRLITPGWALIVGKGLSYFDSITSLE
jgi:hypothetical protein